VGNSVVHRASQRAVGGGRTRGWGTLKTRNCPLDLLRNKIGERPHFLCQTVKERLGTPREDVVCLIRRKDAEGHVRAERTVNAGISSETWETGLQKIESAWLK
jgi:hypothetical protein